MTKISTIAGRKTFLNISSFQTLTMFRRGLYYSYLSIYLRFFLELSVTETTLFASLPMIVNVIFQNFVWGRLSDKLQLRRTLIIIGELTAAIITFLVWYVHILPESKQTAGYVIIIGLTVVEIFWSMSNVAWSALLSDLYPQKERAGLQGKMQSIGAAGRFIGVWIGGLLYDGLPFRYEGWGFHDGWLFYIACSVMVLSTIPMFFVPEGGVAASLDKETEEKSNDEAKSNNNVAARQYLVFLLAMVFVFFGLNAIVILKSQYLSLETGFNISSRTLSYIVNTTTVAIFVSGLFIRRLSNRYRDEHLLLFGVASGILYLIGYGLASNLAAIYISEVFCGVALSIIMASSYAYASRLIPAEKRGKQFAMYNASFFLSWGVPGTFIAGPLVDRLISSGVTERMSYQMAFFASAALMLMGAGILWYNIRMASGRRGESI
jgi:MFS family permease